MRGWRTLYWPSELLPIDPGRPSRAPRADPGQARGDLSASPSRCKCHPYCSLSHPRARVLRRMKWAQAHQNWPDQKLTKAFFQHCSRCLLILAQYQSTTSDAGYFRAVPSDGSRRSWHYSVHIRLIPYTFTARGNNVQPKIAVSRSTQIWREISFDGRQEGDHIVRFLYYIQEKAWEGSENNEEAWTQMFDAVQLRRQSTSSNIPTVASSWFSPWIQWRKLTI